MTKCRFCPNKELKFRDGTYYPPYAMYASCPRCRTNYIFNDTGKTKLSEYSFRTVYKGTTYEACFNLNDNVFVLEAVRFAKEIVVTNSLPNITPFNFYSKLGVYILFS